MNKTPAWENLVLVLSIVAIWPKFILKRPEPLWTWLAYLTLGALALILVRRLIRFREALEKHQRERGN